MLRRCLITIFLVLSATNESSLAISRKAALGKELFFDTNLSPPRSGMCELSRSQGFLHGSR